MARVVGDPEELRRFARDLNRFNSDLRDLTTALHGRLGTLGRTWRDQEHRKFAEQFTETVKVLGKFLDSSDQHVSFLMRKASHLEEYLKQH